MDRRKSNASRALITPEGSMAPPPKALRSAQKGGRLPCRPGCRSPGARPRPHRVPSAPPPAWPARRSPRCATPDGGRSGRATRMMSGSTGTAATGSPARTVPPRSSARLSTRVPARPAHTRRSTPGRPPNTDVNEKPITSRIRRFARARGRAPAGNPAGRPRRVRDRRAWDRPRSRRRHGISSARPVSRWIRRRVP